MCFSLRKCDEKCSLEFMSEPFFFCFSYENRVFVNSNNKNLELICAM